MGRDHWEDLGIGGHNIKTDLRETGINGTNWIRLAQVRYSGGLL
jgi:hypothetical protein